MDVEHVFERGDELVQHHRLAEGPADREALVDRRAGLLEDVVDVARRIDELTRLERRPAGIGVAEDHRRRHRGGDRAHALDVVADTAADLHLQPAETLRNDANRTFRHGVDRSVGDDLVEFGRLALPAAEQRDERHAGGARGEVAAGHVERRLNVGMALEQRVHQPPDVAQRARIPADQVWRDLGDAGAGARREGGRVEVAERRHLAPAGQAVVGVSRRGRNRRHRPRAPSTCGMGRPRTAAGRDRR